MNRNDKVTFTFRGPGVGDATPEDILRLLRPAVNATLTDVDIRQVTNISAEGSVDGRIFVILREGERQIAVFEIDKMNPEQWKRLHAPPRLRIVQ